MDLSRKNSNNVDAFIYKQFRKGGGGGGEKKVKGRTLEYGYQQLSTGTIYQFVSSFLLINKKYSLYMQIIQML